MKKNLAILLFTIAAFGFAESSVFSQFGCAPYTYGRVSHTVVLGVVATPCATCLANCEGSQLECAEECKSVCAPTEYPLGLPAQYAVKSNPAVESVPMGHYSTSTSSLQLGYYSTASSPQQGCGSRLRRKSCFLGRFRN